MTIRVACFIFVLFKPKLGNFIFLTNLSEVFLENNDNDSCPYFWDLGVQMEPHKKQLHISLAYQIHAQDKEKLETQAQGRWFML